MASISGATDNTANVPQWKRDLIQRRRQQNRCANATTTINSASTADSAIADIDCTPNDRYSDSTQDIRDDHITPTIQQPGGAAGHPTITYSYSSLNKPPVACKMHIENGALCSEEAPSMLKNHSEIRYIGKKYDKPDSTPRMDNKSTKNGKNESGDYRRSRIDSDKNITNNRSSIDDCESDSSEELQYGPGIVNKLKSKYLNLTLREMNKNRTVQRFRRAASLEDLLDCDHEADKSPRKFAKKTISTGVSIKTERYRNLSRGNDSMKRARSVEALMRYQCDEDKHSKLLGLRQEPVNDHIVLIDRTSVNIENRLLKNDRPKAINKPKRIRPLLADTERPPADLVKTTLRIFEGSVKKLKPKGEVAVKIATFKTINDTFKAQTMRKVVPKPPLQPKPLVNGNLRASPLAKKNSLLKLDCERAESPEKHKNGVATDSLVQSVSSVVSKFQQIEKSTTPTLSPEPINKLKLSPAPSPEPLPAKVKASTEGCAKAVPIVLCPIDNKKESRLNSIPCHIPLSPSETSQPLTMENTESLLLIQAEKESNTIMEIAENHSQDMILSVEEAAEKGTSGFIEGGMDHLLVDETTGKLGEGENEVSKCPNRDSLGESNVSLESDLNAESKEKDEESREEKPVGAICSLGLIKTSVKETKVKCQKTSPIQKQIGIIRPLVTTKSQVSQNLSNREMEKNLINRVKNIEQPTKVVVSLKTAEEIQVKKSSDGGAGSGSGLWDTKPWNQQNNTMVFNFSNRKDVPDYIENDGLIIRRKRDKAKVGDGGIIVLDSNLDASTTDEGDWEMSRGPPSPCDVLFTNDNVLINGRSNLLRTPRNHKNRIQFNDDATRTFEYPSESSMLEEDGHVGGTCAMGLNDEYQSSGVTKTTCAMSTTGPSPILGGGGLASYTPSKVDLTSDGFELGVTRSAHPPTCPPPQNWESSDSTLHEKIENQDVPDHDTAAWGVEATADLLY